VTASPAPFDASRPHVARVYDYLLGGKDNFAADRTVGERMLASIPAVQLGVRAQRDVLGRVVEVASGLRLRAWLSQADDVKIRERVTELLAMGSLTDKAERPVGELSHGDQRATEIMMALALKPRLLLLDEPTAGMGDQETYQITQLIRRLHRDSNYTIVLIEHDMRVVFHLADRICVLDQGRMLAQGTPQEIAANEAVQAAYLGNAA